MKAKTTPVMTPMARKAIYLSHFTPSMMPAETLQAMLVQRQPLLDTCFDDVVHSATTAAKHHYLFVGPRGIGKTHLISLLHHRLEQAPAIQRKALIAWMREEEWGVTSFFELVLRILRTLDQYYPDMGIQVQTDTLYELSLKQAEANATSLLLKALGKKTLIVLMENLDDLFEQIGDAGQRQWRAFLQNHPQFVIVATTPSLFSGVSVQKSPFYGFFDIQPLKEFEFADVVILLEKIATERGDPGLVKFIQSPEGRARVRAIHHLAEGNPRIYVIFAQFLSQEALDELVQAFMHTLDELTPYYQARMKELSGQQRKIVEYLVNYRGAAPVKQIAKSCFITHQTCSGQLKQLRDKRYVRSIEQGRESYYELSEPLMRLCMEVKKQRGKPISLFVEILRIWYTTNDLQQWLANPQQFGRLDTRYVKAAIEGLGSKGDPKVDAILHDLRIAKNASDWTSVASLLNEFTAICSDPIAWELKAAMLLSSPEVNLTSLNKDDLTKLAIGLEEQLSNPRFKTNQNTWADLLFTYVQCYLRLFAASKDLAERASKPLANLLLAHPAEAAVALIALLVVVRLGEFEPWLQSLVNAMESAGAAASFGRMVQRNYEALISGKESELLKLPVEERKLLMTHLRPAFEFAKQRKS